MDPPVYDSRASTSFGEQVGWCWQIDLPIPALTLKSLSRKQERDVNPLGCAHPRTPKTEIRSPNPGIRSTPNQDYRLIVAVVPVNLPWTSSTRGPNRRRSANGLEIRSGNHR